jgi:hypothetical protein
MSRFPVLQLGVEVLIARRDLRLLQRCELLARYLINCEDTAITALEAMIFLDREQDEPLARSW